MRALTPGLGAVEFLTERWCDGRTASLVLRPDRKHPFAAGDRAMTPGRILSVGLCVIACLVASAWLVSTSEDSVGYSQSNRVIDGHLVVATFGRDHPNGRLLHVIILPTGVGAPTMSAYSAGHFRLSKVPIVPHGIHTRAGAIYLDGVRTPVEPGRRIFVLSSSRKWIIVPIPDARLETIHEPGFERLQQLPEWKTSVAAAIKKATEQ